MMDRLSEKNLWRATADVQSVPYDRAAVTPGIVHLGVGAFHRAHQAVFTDDRLVDGEADWGIVAVSMRSADTRDALEPQNNLYTLALRDSDGERLRIVGSIKKTIVAPESPEQLLAAMSDPAIRIVTLTVTEKGYTANLAARTLDTAHADVVHDLANPSTPKSVLGYLTEAILRRRRSGTAPFTLLSCDNLPSNGATLKAVLTEFARRRDPELADFIATNVSCPSSMVDRIVPATTDADRKRISSELGLQDAWPVVAEPYFQWVIEDRFPTGRPRWERSGVQFVKDVVPFEHMKLRMLNGAHTAIAAIGQIAGMETVADTVAEGAVQAFLKTYWGQAGLTIDPSLDPQGYAARLLDRFSNPSLRHRTEQIASDASQKLPQRVLAPLAEVVAMGLARDALVFAVAAWIQSCAAHDERGNPLRVNDPTFRAWAEGRSLEGLGSADIVDEFFLFAQVFDGSWRDDASLRFAVAAALDNIRNLGVIAALERAFGSAAKG